MRAVPLFQHAMPGPMVHLGALAAMPADAMMQVPPHMGPFPTQPSLPSAWQAQFEVVKEMPVIGSGSFGTIFHVRDRGNLCTFAVKVMQRSHYERRGMGKQIPTEIQAMQRALGVCSDPGWSRVVQLHGVVEEAGFIFLLLELCVHGNMAQQLGNAPGGWLCESTAARCTRHLLQGLRDIHAAGIIHRDIKPENLLLTTNGVLKISDFGWAAEARDAPTGLAGTFETMAPELLKELPQTTAVDLWSAGAVIFHMVTGRKLLKDQDPRCSSHERQQRTLKDIKACCPPPATARPPHASKACWDLLQRLLEPDVKCRITAADALHHPWLRSEKSGEPMPMSYWGGA